MLIYRMQINIMMKLISNFEKLTKLELLTYQTSLYFSNNLSQINFIRLKWDVKVRLQTGIQNQI